MKGNIRSLSSYINALDSVDETYAVNAVIPAAMATVANNFGVITVGFNNQYSLLLDSLNARRTDLAQSVNRNLVQNPGYTGSRNAGVKLAWQYEKADIEMGGKGSANWNADERNQILNSKTGTVSGAEGHHQKNVVDHPKEQANPDNIKFYKSKEEHLQEGHNGNFKNESDAPMIDKNRMLQKTNNRRVFLNEIKGMSISAAIGFGVTFTISIIAQLSSLGIDIAERDEVFFHSLKSGMEGGAISAITYGVGRWASTFMQKQGLDLLSKVGNLVNYAAVGGISIALVSTIQFVKMKMNEIETTEVLKQVGKSVLFSTSSLIVSIIAQGVYGGYAGLIVSTSIGLFVLTTDVIESNQKRRINNKINEYAIEEYKPILIMG